jgi:hypothetical protein
MARAAGAKTVRIKFRTASISLLLAGLLFFDVTDKALTDCNILMLLTGVARKSCKKKSMVPEVGFEPTLPCGKRILSPLRLPFRHSGLLMSIKMPRQEYKINGTCRMVCFYCHLLPTILCIVDSNFATTHKNTGQLVNHGQ